MAEVCRGCWTLGHGELLGGQGGGGQGAESEAELRAGLRVLGIKNI